MINKISGKIINGDMINRMSQLKTNVILSYFSGPYKKLVQSKKTLAKEAVLDFETAKQAKTIKIEVPLLSKYGLKTLWYHFIDKFRKKSPEEKLYKKLLKTIERSI